MVKNIFLSLLLIGMAMPVQARVVEKQIGDEWLKQGTALVMGALLGFGVKKLVTACKTEVTPGQVKTYAIREFEKLQKTPIDAESVAQKKADLAVVFEMFRALEDNYINDGMEPDEKFIKYKDAITAYEIELAQQKVEEQEKVKASISKKTISSKKTVNAVGIILGLLVGGAFAKFVYSVGGEVILSREELRVYALAELDRVNMAAVDRNHLAERQQDLETIRKMLDAIKENEQNQLISEGGLIQDDPVFERKRKLVGRLLLQTMALRRQAPGEQIPVPQL